MKKLPIITIVIATFNSEKTLPLVLNSIKKQSFPKKDLEVIIVDGGSIDSTLVIAQNYQCRIINNPRTEPVYAKFLGYLHAQGKYLIYLDHDEVIMNEDSLLIKYRIVMKHHKVKVVLGSGYVTSKNISFINYYINEFGDPFSFFIYRLSKDMRFFIWQLKKRYKLTADEGTYCLFDLSGVVDLPLIELCAIGSMVDSQYMKKEFPETLKNPSLIPHFFYLLQNKSSFIAVSKSDGLLHYSSDTFRKYLNKIRWRVKNNVYHIKDMGLSGYTGRERYQSKYMSFKKYLFILYSFSVIGPLFDALILVVSRKKSAYFVHIFLCVYTSSLILYHFICKSLGAHPTLKSYDGTKDVSQKIKYGK